MTIRLYNTATRTKEEFHPLEPGKVRMYVCGVTVYDLCHIGHARSSIVFDVMVRYLRSRGFEVNYVRNFTDIDDKIIERARALGKDTATLAQEQIDAFYEDMGRLGVMKADHEPRATNFIAGMIDMIRVLMEKGFAYLEGNDVFYSVESFWGYGALSGRKLEEMKAGSRVAVDEKKRHPMDFVLWKGAKPGEPQWPSPWGPGRPGWHIECSVMSSYYLGPTFDIHGGGKDLLFPHHENERAQSLAANGGDFARYWVHNGFVTVESEKMSKSTGNFLTIRDALEIYHPEVLRIFLLSKHYRSPLDFSRDTVLEFQSALVRIYRTLQRVDEILGDHRFKGEESAKDLSGDGEGSFLQEFIRVMDDDLNTAGGIGLLFDKTKEMNRVIDAQTGTPDRETLSGLDSDRRDLLTAGRVLGILTEQPRVFLQKLSMPDLPIPEGEIERMIDDRARARMEKRWADADAIRSRLKEIGIVLEDGPKGTTWRVELKKLEV
jgi:cysteinyl-tRNA synthetase